MITSVEELYNQISSLNFTNIRYRHFNFAKNDNGYWINNNTIPIKIFSPYISNEMVNLLNSQLNSAGIFPTTFRLIDLEKMVSYSRYKKLNKI